MSNAATVVSGGGAWSREARRVTLLAAELNLSLDHEALILCDVRDLMTLRHLLLRAMQGDRRKLRDPYGILRPASSTRHDASPPGCSLSA